MSFFSNQHFIIHLIPEGLNHWIKNAFLLYSTNFINLINITLWRCKFFHLVNYDLSGHGRSHKVIFLSRNLLFLRYLLFLKSDLDQIWLNANITKMQIFHNMTFDFFITLTYVLMDNFCPCFLSTQLFIKHLITQGFESIKLQMLSCFIPHIFI